MGNSSSSKSSKNTVTDASKAREVMKKYGIEEKYRKLFLRNNRSMENERLLFMENERFKELIGLRYDNGSYGIHFAAQDRHSKVVKMFLDMGVDANLQGADGRSPLHFTDYDNDCVKLLLEAGANPNATDNNGTTPLHHLYVNKDYVKLLLEADANPNIVNNSGATPLHYVVSSKYSNYKCAELMVMSGAKFDIIDDDGYTAYARAKKNGHENIVALFDRVMSGCVIVNSKQSEGVPPPSYIESVSTQ